MHGMILSQLDEHARSELGAQRWLDVQARLGLAVASYSHVQSVPDPVVTALAVELARERGVPVETALRDFGRFIAPRLLDAYAPFVDPTWSLADLLEHVERVIHRSVRVSDPSAAPPFLAPRRTSPDSVAIRYMSRRRLCALAEGLIAGLAESYHVDVAVAQPRCMTRGDDACEIVVDIHPRA